MNFYNLKEFKCGKCQQWYHPHNAQPYLLSCQHSVCGKCIRKIDKNGGVITCPYHRNQQPVRQLTVNEHILQALIRLMNNYAQPRLQKDKSNTSSMPYQLEMLLNEKNEDKLAFSQLLDRIYTNQINRIVQLKNRVKMEVIGHSLAYEQWKNKKKQQGSTSQLIEEAKIIEERIRDFNSLDIEAMAEMVIEDPHVILQRNFSIYDLVKKERKTLKSSVKPNTRQPRPSNTSLSSIAFPPEKQNEKHSNFMVRTIESPEPLSHNNNLTNLLCKQMSSFKLDSSVDNCLQEYTMKHSTNKGKEHSRYPASAIIDEPTYLSNGDITLREGQSRQNMKTRPNEKYSQHDYKSSHFTDLINSLRSQDELVYSSEPSQEMLLSECKPEINFLQECPFERPEKKEDIQVRQRKLINIEKESNKYIKKMEETRTDEALLKTNLTNHTIQLFNYDLKDIDLKHYLDKYNQEEIMVVKLVGTGLHDNQFNQLLNYLLKTKIHTLLLPNNELHQISLDALINFSNRHPHLKTVSLQRNNISKLQSSVRAKLALLQQRGLTIYI